MRPPLSLEELKGLTNRLKHICSPTVCRGHLVAVTAALLARILNFGGEFWQEFLAGTMKVYDPTPRCMIQQQKDLLKGIHYWY